MDRQLYLKLKTIFEAYEFNDQANFYSLYKHARRYKLPFYFKQFCTYARDMGVKSVVLRDGATVKRVLLYDRHADKYINTLFPELETCPTCKGSGMVKIDMA